MPRLIQSTPRPSSDRRPNILIMMADDHRFESIAANGNAPVYTPTMDRLMREGSAFCRNWHTGSYSGAVCIPTRAALHTGTNAYEASLHKDFRDASPPDVQTIHPQRITLGEAFRQEGYYTYATGKWHNDPASLNRSFCDARNIFFGGGMHDHYSMRLFDFDPSGQYPEEYAHVTHRHDTELYAETALEFLEGYQGEEPFLLLVAFTSPHDPRQAPLEYRRQYAAEDINLPPNFGQHPFDQGHNRIRDERLASFPRQDSEIKKHIADYYAIISHQDRHMGLILQALEKRGDLDNTLILYTSDHGLAVGQHGLMGKQNLYEHSVRVPLIFRGPGIPGNQRIDQLTQTPDAYPTLCELAGIDTPSTVTADSLVPLMRDPGSAGHTHCFSLYFDLQRSVCDDRFKLIRYYVQSHNYFNQSPGSEHIQLFDLQEDPSETKNLYGDKRYKAIAHSLAQALQARMDRYDDPLRSVPILY